MGDQVYTKEQRIAAMKAAGWPTEVIPTGVAVSLAESWNGKGINNNPPVEYSVGPWQINLLAHPNITESQALDLNYSTAYALQLWQSQGFQPWGAFTNGSYLKYLDPGSASGGSSGSASLDAGVSSTANAAQSATATGVNKFGFTFPELNFGPLKVDSSPLFKVAITVGALVLLFVGIKSAVEA